MELIKVKRSGQLPLTFEGELIREENGWQWYGKEQSRYHVVSLYRTNKSKQYILHIRFVTRWRGEPALEEAHLLGPEKGAMIEFFRNYDPVPRDVGYPHGDHYEEKQGRLERDIRNRFAALVAELLEDVEGAEERIE